MSAAGRGQNFGLFEDRIQHIDIFSLFHNFMRTFKCSQICDWIVRTPLETLDRLSLRSEPRDIHTLNQHIKRRDIDRVAGSETDGIAGQANADANRGKNPRKYDQLNAIESTGMHSSSVGII